MSESKQIICVAVDIEKTGSTFNHPCCSVGFYVSDLDGKKLQTLKVNLWVDWPVITNDKLDYRDFEPRCWDEFWSKQPADILEKAQQECIPQAIGWKKICNFIDTLEVLYPSDTHKIVFATDNASFDIANIDYNLLRYCSRMPMRYTKTENYRSIVAADDMFDMLPAEIRNKERKLIDEQVTHDHDCINDAKYICLQYIAVRRYLNK